MLRTGHTARRASERVRACVGPACWDGTRACGRGTAAASPSQPPSDLDVDRRHLFNFGRRVRVASVRGSSFHSDTAHLQAWRAQSGRQGVRAAGEAGCPGVCRPSSRSCLSCACAWCEPHRRGCASAQATRRALRAGAGDVGPVARGGAGCGCAAAAGCSCGYGLLVVRTGRARGWVLSGASSRRAAVAARLPAFACACAGGPRTGAGGTARPARWAAVPSLYCIPGCGGV